MPRPDVVARLVLLWGGALVACPQDAAELPSRPLEPTFDVGAVVRKVRQSWRQEAGEWRAVYGTHEATLKGGALHFRPYHTPSGVQGGAEPQLDAAPELVVRGEPVHFGASLVTMGGLALGEATGAPRGEGRVVRWVRGAFVEEWENGELGVEQRWRFQRRPERKAGALEVRIPVESGDFAGASAGGLHFRAGELMVRYGHGTWVDARGRKTAVPAQYKGGAIVLRVAPELVESSAFPAVLDPVIGPETGMDQPVSSSAYGVQARPAAAWNGAQTLVVWQDERLGASSRDIYGARVDASGVVQDVAGILISSAVGKQSAPTVAWDGTNWFVVWEDERNGASSTDVYGARVGSTGVVLDAAGIPISTAVNKQLAPAVAWDGASSFLIVWQDERNGVANLDIYAARVSPSGQVLDASGFAISTAASNQSEPSLDWDGTNFFVVWRDFRGGNNADVYGARVQPTGTVLDGAGVAISTAANNQQSPAVVWDGTNHFVVWEDDRNIAGSPDIFGARVTSQGLLLDAAGVLLNGGNRSQRAPAVAWNGTNYLVVWEDDRSGMFNE